MLYIVNQVAELYRLSQIIFIFVYILLTSGLVNATELAETDSSEFVISYQSMPISLDPHARRVSPDIAFAAQIYDSFFLVTDDGSIQSRILESWQAEDDRTWVFKLKHNILFQDGSPLTSKDVIYSFDRIQQLAESDYKTFIKRWKGYEAIDDYTVKITTREPNSNLTRDLGRIFILKYHATMPLSAEQLMAEKAYIGTGAYRLDGWAANGDILLSAHPYYNGQPILLKKVRINHIANPKERVMALGEGRIQLAEGLTEQELSLLKDNKQVSVVRSPTHRLIHLLLDVYNDQSPFIRGPHGELLKENPLKNPKVRKAISLAIDRSALVDKVLNGDGIPSGQYLLPEVTGYVAGIDANPKFSETARQLLKEAGYPDGLQLTIYGPMNRYVKDKEVLEEIADMLTQIGIKTKAVAMDRIKFFEEGEKHQYSVSMLGVSTDGNLQSFLEVLVHSQTPELGIFNDGRYANPEVDSLIEEAGKQFNQITRLRYLMQATELSLQDYAIIPLYFEKAIWGVRNDIGVEFWPRRLGYTMVQDIHQARHGPSP